MMYSVLILGIIFLQGVLSLDLQHYVSCYGSTGLDNFLRPTCLTNEKIAVVGLSTLAKKSETGCPVEITPINAASTSDSCCLYDEEDCSLRYSASVYRTYYQQCNGRMSCTIQVSWVNTPCNLTVYIPRTNYMKMDYYCISDQGLDPCSSLNTKDSRVFLWNSGYPSTPLSGLSSCTCSVEASCDSNIQLTAIDLRFDTTGTCNQNLIVTDGSSVYTFDCSYNNDYLPTVLFTSSSHFIQVQIVNNQASNGGYYFILLEGAASGSELTLSCSSSSQTTPTLPASSLPVCPDSESTSTMRTTQLDDESSSTIRATEYATSTERSFIISTIELNENVSTITLEDSSTVNSPHKTIETTLKYSTVDDSTSQTDQIVSGQSLATNTASSNTKASVVTTTTHSETSNDATPVSHTEATSPDTDLPLDISNEPTFVSLGWISTEKDISGTLTSAIGQYTSTKSSKEQSTTSQEEEPESDGSNSSLIIGIVVVLILLVALIAVFFFYKDKIKEKCCKSKGSSKVDMSDDTDELPQYASIFDTDFDIGSRQKSNQLPPLMHRFKSNLTLENEPIKKKKTKIVLPKLDKQDHSENVKEKHEKKHRRKKKDKGKKKKTVEPEEVFSPRKPSYSKSGFGSPLILGLGLSLGRKHSIIDITDTEGRLEKTVDIENIGNPL